MIHGDQLVSLRALCPDAAEKQEAGMRLVLLPKLRLNVGSEERIMDALLAVSAHAGYTTRLFLAMQITERPAIGGGPANWSQHHILGRNWWTWSWQGVSPDLPWIQILVAHLRALR